MRLLRVLIFLAGVVQHAHCQWEIQQSNTLADLRGIHFVGGGVAWASGTKGTILRTTDDGENWQHCATPPDADKLDFRGIQAFDHNTAIVMSSGKGDLSRIYKTTDGCKTWKLVFTNPDSPSGFFDTLQMNWLQQDLLGNKFNPLHAQGMIAGDPVGLAFSVFTTNDGGDTWTRRVPVHDRETANCKVDPVRAKPNEAMFAASNQSLIGPLGSGEFLLATGGAVSRLIYIEHWDLDFAFCHQITHAVNLPFSQVGDSSGAFAITAIPGKSTGMFQFQKLVAVGGDYSKPDAPAESFDVYFTFSVLLRDRTRVERSFTSPHGYRSSVSFDTPSGVLITVGPNGTDISRDGGKNWSALKPAAQNAPRVDKNWNALSLPFVVGPQGRIGKLRSSTLNP